MTVVTRPEVFSTDPYTYTPAELKARDRELTLLEKATIDYAETSFPLLLVVSGRKASGKTITLIRFVKTQTEKNGGKIRLYLLRPESTMRDALATCELFSGCDVPRTLSSAVHFLAEQVKSLKLGKICIFIDDAQRYAWSDVNDALRFFFEHGASRILPALVFNIPIEEMKSRIQLDVQSRYAWGSGGTIPIGFHAYNYEDMYHILLQRAEEGLQPKAWTEGAITEATTHGISVGDVRQAISMLRAAAEQTPKNGRLGTEEMRAALDAGNILTLIEDVNNLTIADRLYLLSIALQYVKDPKAKDRGVSTAPVDEAYERICHTLKVAPMSSRSTRWLMRVRLQDEAEMIANEYYSKMMHSTSGQSQRGRSTIMKLKPNPKLLLKALSKADWGSFIQHDAFAKLFKL